MSVEITVDQFKTYFARGQFTYGSEVPYVMDADIENAIAEAEAIFNHDLYPKENIERMALLYLTAHFLQSDLDAADSDGQPSFVQNSRSANGISESRNIPEWMMSGDFALYVTTYYGQKWLMLSKPYLGGAVYSVPGRTSP